MQTLGQGFAQPTPSPLEITEHILNAGQMSHLHSLSLSLKLKRKNAVVRIQIGREHERKIQIFEKLLQMAKIIIELRKFEGKIGCRWEIKSLIQGFRKGIRKEEKKFWFICPYEAFYIWYQPLKKSFNKYTIMCIYIYIPDINVK